MCILQKTPFSPLAASLPSHYTFHSLSLSHSHSCTLARSFSFSTCPSLNTRISTRHTKTFPMTIQTMKAVVLRNTLIKPAYHKVELADIPRPTLKPNQALVKVNAVSLNHRDVWFRKGLSAGIVWDSTLGSDAVGRITELSTPSSHLKIGDRVLIMPSIGWNDDIRGPESADYVLAGGSALTGAFSEYIAADQDQLFKVPEYLTDEEAAALPIASLTAFRALFTKGQVTQSQNVFVTGIGGGVALAALSFARVVGANVYVSSSDNAKIEKAIQLGAKGGVNYREENWGEQLLKLTNQQPIDVAIDGAGGPGTQFLLNKALRPGGILVNFGQGAGPIPLEMAAVIRNVEVRSCTMGSRAQFGELLVFLEKHRLRPVISKVWDGLENVIVAMEEMNSGSQFGKLVVRVY